MGIYQLRTETTDSPQVRSAKMESLSLLLPISFRESCIIEFSNGERQERDILVMEQYDGDLLKFLTEINLTENSKQLRVIRYLFSRIIYGVFQLHQLAIAHCDIKPENILTNISRFQNRLLISICDLGNSQFIGPPLPAQTQYRGTLNWAEQSAL